jgi:hypothetical protein
MNADNDDHGLTTALRDRLDDVRPDLDRLVAVATRQGTRIRRRTRLAVSVGSVAGVAAVAVAVAAGNSWTGSGPSGAPGQPGFADEPSFSSSTSAPTPSAITTSPPSPTAPTSHAEPPPERSPVHLQLAGWSCTPPADEKFVCTSAEHSLVINWRPASERQFWGNNPDKSADFISDVHGRFFVTVVVQPGTPSSDAVTVGQALIWADGTPTS